MEYIYEILVRGSASGLVGAHVIRGRSVVDGDGDTHQKIGGAERLPLDEVATVLGAEVPKYVQQIEQLQAELATSRIVVSQREQTILSFLANETELKAQIVQLHSELDTSRKDLEISQNRLDSLSTKLNETNI